jgi:hypothetical protein
VGGPIVKGLGRVAAWLDSFVPICVAPCQPSVSLSHAASRKMTKGYMLVATL